MKQHHLALTLSISILEILTLILPAFAQSVEELVPEAPLKISSFSPFFPSPSLSKSPNPQNPAPFTENSDETNEAMEQVTSITQLSDVQPTDWAYQALKSLIERYGINLGYADGTFRGNKPMTRFEFAAALEEALTKIQFLDFSDYSEETLQEDFLTLQRLQREFSEALAQLRGRLDNIDNRMTTLEDNRFSATTKLKSQLILAATDSNDASASFISRQRLQLLTGWKTGGLLTTQLEMGSGGGDGVSRAQNKGKNLLGSNGLLAGAGGLDYVESDNLLRLNRLYYTFKPLSNVSVSLGAKMVASDFLDRNRFANNEAVDFNSSLFLNNPLIVQNQIEREAGAGAAVTWDIAGKPLSITAVYIAADAENPAENRGFFGERNQASIELKYSPTPSWAVRLQYTKAVIDNTDINAFGINGEWAYSRTLGIFARLGVSSYKGFNTALNRQLDATPLSWAVGVTLRNFFVPGTLAGVGLGQPFVTGDVGDATQTNFEAFLNLLLSDNISFTPAFILVTNADNDEANGAIWQFNFRTVFSF